jgi:hypothetical protein
MSVIHQHGDPVARLQPRGEKRVRQAVCPVVKSCVGENLTVIQQRGLAGMALRCAPDVVAKTDAHERPFFALTLHLRWS